MRLFNINNLFRGSYYADAAGRQERLRVLNNWLHKNFNYNNGEFLLKKIIPINTTSIWLVEIKNDDDAMLFKLKWPDAIELSSDDDIDVEFEFLYEKI